MAQANTFKTEWPLVKKLPLCFLFIFFTLYIFVNPNAVLPYSFYVHNLYARYIVSLFTWLSRDVFRLTEPSVGFINSTIDSVFGYLTLLYISCVAFLGSLVWVSIERGRCNYDRLYNLFIQILRYFLALAWIAYGSIKFARLQFPVLTPEMLLQTYGNSTPKALAWSFMGYSDGYNYFIGAIECGIGAMLFFRRTSTLGNLLGLVILANVMAFNYSFDVNVKLLSTVLMAMSLCLFTKDIKGLINFFFRHEVTVLPLKTTAYFKGKWKNTALVYIKCTAIIIILFLDLRGDFALSRQSRVSALKTPLYGIYNVLTFVWKKDILPPLTTDTVRWKKLAISSPGGGTIMMMNDNMENIAVRVDTNKKALIINAKGNPTDQYRLAYKQVSIDKLLLFGTLNNGEVQILLHKTDINKLPLMRRKFRWIIDHHYRN